MLDRVPLLEKHIDDYAGVVGADVAMSEPQWLTRQVADNPARTREVASR